MSKIIKPYVADCRIGKESYENLEVVDLNNKSIWVRLPNGDLVKRNIIKHKVDVKPVLIGVKDGRSTARR